jgi:E3 ubiquitin-protein ligase UBR4
MVQPRAILVQELRTGNSKVKALDVVAFRHTSASGKESKTSLLMLCEDGSLRVHNVQADKTSTWIPTSAAVTLAASFPKVPRKKKYARSVSKPAAPSGVVSHFAEFLLLKNLQKKKKKNCSNYFPFFSIEIFVGSRHFATDFFEHCQPLQDVDFGGQELLYIYSSSQLKRRLTEHGELIQPTSPVSCLIFESECSTIHKSYFRIRVQ